jgi:sigma54-dependent transcription regulator
MPRLLLTWMGTKDFEGTEPGKPPGPVAEAVAAFAFDEIHILSGHTTDRTSAFVEWLETRTRAPIAVHPVTLSKPTYYREICEHAIATCAAVTAQREDRCELTFHLSPDSNAMDAVWLLVAATRYPATLIESSSEPGVQPAVRPLEISAELSDSRLTDLTAAAPEPTSLAGIVHLNREMAGILEQAARAARQSALMLIDSKSGTRKKLLARAIHASSGRKGAFIAINCGAIPYERIESELFGHKQGAFTGAAHDRAGAFEVANHGTLFLDELGELPLDVQAKLLGVMQERQVIRVGSTDAIKIDVRIVAATRLPYNN